jgi:hypothetical protein
MVVLGERDIAKDSQVEKSSADYTDYADSNFTGLGTNQVLCITHAAFHVLYVRYALACRQQPI